MIDSTLTLPSRAARPRQAGMTVMLDPGLSWLRDADAGTR